MSYVITEHARRQMHDRQVTEQEVQETLADPDETWTTGGDAVHHRKEFATGIVRVTCTVNDVILTIAVWGRNQSKDWKPLISIRGSKP